MPHVMEAMERERARHEPLPYAGTALGISHDQPQKELLLHTFYGLGTRGLENLNKLFLTPQLADLNAGSRSGQHQQQQNSPSGQATPTWPLQGVLWTGSEKERRPPNSNSSLSR